MSGVTKNEELFMNFLRYVQMLDPSDEKKLQGQKLIDRIYEIEKYKAYKNQSLHILEHESIIQDEDLGDDQVNRVHI